MADTWDEEGFEPTVQPTLTAAGNQWEGEDEEEDVKVGALECWEDDEEEKKDEEKVEEKVVVAPPPKSKAKKLAEKLAEKEKAALFEVDEDLLDGVGLTKEEIELRRRRMQEESDLKVAMETFGITDTAATNGGLDAFNPTTKEEFDEFQKALVDKISLYRDKEEFPEFITALVKNICLHLSSITLKSLKTNIENLYLEKQKLEKADKSKKPNKGKGKAKLTVESNISQMTKYGYENEFEFDDFM